MAEFLGTIAGIGNSETRQNEILPKFTANSLYSIRNINYGVLRGIMDEFGALISVNSFTVYPGQMTAYGYDGYIDSPVTFTYQFPATTQYYIIYAELNLSVVPNTFKIIDYYNANSSDIPDFLKPNKQSNLLRSPTGIFRLPLWILTLTSSKITAASVKTYANGVKEATNAVEAQNTQTIKNVDLGASSQSKIGDNIIEKKILIWSGQFIVQNTTGQGTTLVLDAPLQENDRIEVFFTPNYIAPSTTPKTNANFWKTSIEKINTINGDMLGFRLMGLRGGSSSASLTTISCDTFAVSNETLTYKGGYSTTVGATNIVNTTLSINVLAIYKIIE